MDQETKDIGTGNYAHDNLVNNGINHLLVIAIDEYNKYPLSSCVKDANDLIKELTERYHFNSENITILYNDKATRTEVLRAINRYKTISTADNLIIYYSGHGKRDKNKGFWIPFNTDDSDDAEWISITDLKERLNDINCFHLLLMVDACFGGTLFFEETKYKSIENTRLESYKSRRGITSSHSREIAYDGKPGENSPFAECLLETLRNTEFSIGTSRLFSDITQKINKLNTLQTPVAGRLDVQGHDNGEFYFHLKSSKKIISNEVLEIIDEINRNMVFIRKGGYLMGDKYGEGYEDEKPLHYVEISAFYLNKFAVTQLQWISIMGNDPSFYNGDYLPVEHVSWNDVQEFIKKLNSISGKNYRLPSEVEWEFAARDRGSETRFGNGKMIAICSEMNFDARIIKNDYTKETEDFQENYIQEKDDKYFYEGKYRDETLTVNFAKPNLLGLYNMSGNVFEWCDDLYSDYTDKNNPHILSNSNLRVYRGGSFNSKAKDCRASARSFIMSNNNDNFIGFRLAHSY
jgi:formylglycine-generating enzyme required for sulfatase activity